MKNSKFNFNGTFNLLIDILINHLKMDLNPPPNPDEYMSHTKELIKELKDIKPLFELNYCPKCQKFWLYNDNSFEILRVNPGDKQITIIKRCYKCKILTGEFNYSLLLDFLKLKNWEVTKDTSQNTYTAVHPKKKDLEGQKVFFIFPKSNKISTKLSAHEFEWRLENLLHLVQQLQQDPTADIYNQLISFLLENNGFEKDSKRFYTDRGTPSRI